MTTSQAFDPLASTYDTDFTDTIIGRYLRQRVHDRLVKHFNADDSILELGCGTGEDTLFLAGRGVDVTATDVSEAMLAVAREKLRSNPRVNVMPFDLNKLNDYDIGARHKSSLQDVTFDGAFANFGPLNVLDDWQPLAQWLAEHIKPGGIVAFGVMSPYCLWEIGWHGLHGDLKTACRRLRNNAAFQPNDAKTIPIYYPTVRRLTRDFAPHFKRIHVEGLGLFLPPSDVFDVIEKHRRLLKILTMLEERFARLALFAPFADHYWIEFERLT